MKYWLTTHWAPSIRKGKTQPHKDVWIKDGRHEAIEPVKPEDLVFIYESAGGKKEKETNAQGDDVVIRRERGRQGVVALLEVTAEAVEVPFRERRRYVNDDQTWWRYRADTQSVNSMGFIDKVRVCQIVGWEENYSMRGIGKMNSGILELTPDQFRLMEAEFLASQPAPQDILDRAARAPHVGGGNGGEGPVHEALKLRVAGDPAGVLKEAGLQCVRIEAPFATNDRVEHRS